MVLYTPLKGSEGTKGSTYIFTPSAHICNSEYYEYEFFSDWTPYEKWSDISLKSSRSRSIFTSNAIFKIIGDSEEHKIGDATMESFLSLDTSNLSDTQIDGVIDVLPKFDKLVQDIVIFSKKVLGGGGMTAQEVIDINTSHSERLSYIFDALDNNDARIVFQHALAEEVSKVRKDAERTVQSQKAKEIAQTADRKPSAFKRFFLGSSSSSGPSS